MKFSSPRSTNFFGFLLSILLLAGAYYLQYFQNVQPCLLCLLQRWMLIAIAIIFFLGALHNPEKIGRKIYAFFTFLFSLMGILAATRQVWLQHQPLTSTTTCMPDLNFLLRTRTLPEVFKMMLQGSSDCAKAEWHFMSLSLAQWSLVFFVLLGIISLIQLSRR